MKRKKDYIEELLGKFMEGQTTETEEQILSKYFCEARDIPTKWQEYKQLFLSFKTDAYDFSKEEIEAMLVSNQQKNTSVINIWTLVSAVCAAAVLLLLVWHPCIENTVNEISPIAVTKPIDVAEAKTDVNVKAQDETVIQMTQKTSLLSSTKSHVSKSLKDNSRKHLKSEPDKVQEISASEMIEAVYTLSDLCPDDINITVSPVSEGFAVNASNGNSYILKLSCDGSISMEQTSQFINI